jgi:hypothetical protein
MSEYCVHVLTSAECCDDWQAMLHSTLYVSEQSMIAVQKLMDIGTGWQGDCCFEQ